MAQVAFTCEEGSGFHGSNQTTLLLHFPFIEMFAEDLVGYLLDRVELWNGKTGVFYVMSARAPSGQAGARGAASRLKIATVTSV